MQWRCDKNGTPFGDTSPLLNITVNQGADDSQFLSQTAVPTSIGPSKTFGVTFTYKNLGTATWNNASYSLVSIGSNNFGITSIPSQTVAQNGTGTFTATFTAPATAGAYTFQWRTAHGSTKFGNPTTKVTIVVSADAGTYVSRTGPLTVNAGADFWVQNTMKNTGTTTWTSSGGYSMMSINNDTTWTATRLYMPANSSIAPGSQATFTGLCTAPITPGTKTMQWQLDKSGVAFGEKSPLLTITIVVGPDDAQYISQTGVPTTIAHGATFNATVTMKNLGTATWGAGYTLVPIGSNTFGIASINAVSTAQNANDAFSATFTAPSTPGSYTFQMRMAHSGTKFGQPSVKVTITVT
jgi:hypothetical protein